MAYDAFGFEDSTLIVVGLQLVMLALLPTLLIWLRKNDVGIEEEENNNKEKKRKNTKAEGEREPLLGASSRLSELSTTYDAVVVV